MSRLEAFVLHMAVTAMVLFVVYVLMRFWWYPYPLLRADGAWAAYALVAGGGIVLGPLLTLMVFKPGKKSLRWDLAAIGLMQAGVLAFTMHVLYTHRIQLVVFAHRSFYALDAAHVARIGVKGQALLAAAHEEPLYVYVHLPHNKKALWAAEIRTLQGEPPIFLRGWRYRAYTKAESVHVATHGYPLAKVSHKNAVAAAALKAFEIHHPHLAHYAFVPLHGIYTTVTWVLRRDNGRVVAVLPFNAGYGRLPETQGGGASMWPRPAKRAAAGP